MMVLIHKINSSDDEYGEESDGEISGSSSEGEQSDENLSDSSSSEEEMLDRNDPKSAEVT